MFLHGGHSINCTVRLLEWFLMRFWPIQPAFSQTIHSPEFDTCGCLVLAIKTILKYESRLSARRWSQACVIYVAQLAYGGCWERSHRHCQNMPSDTYSDVADCPH